MVAGRFGSFSKVKRKTEVKNFKIVDSFLFSEIFEKELLLLKLMIEDSCIDEWIILENAYSFQGEYIGLQAKDLIENDPRFQPYKEKITIISKEMKTAILPKHVFLDDLSYKVEYWQRDLAYDYFINKYTENDWIMVSDVDEIIDFTDLARKNELLLKLANSKSGLVVFPTKRYWYDFDNEYKMMIGNAMCRKNYLLQNEKKLHQVRSENRRVINSKWKNIIAFEYSSCYDKEYIMRKFYTSTHTGFTQNDLKLSLRCNHRPTREFATWKADNNKYWFFETAQLTENNSPKFVRENLQSLKTGNIDVQYKLNRRKEYPDLFTMKYFINRFTTAKKKYLLKKAKNFRYKVKAFLHKA